MRDTVGVKPTAAPRCAGYLGPGSGLGRAPVCTHCGRVSAKLRRVTTSRNGREPVASRAWADEAVRRIEADANRSADTHLHAFPLPEEWDIDLYLKDESMHPTGCSSTGSRARCSCTASATAGS